MKIIITSLLLLFTLSLIISCDSDEAAGEPTNPLQEDLMNGAWDQNTSSTFDPNSAVSEFTITTRKIYITDPILECILTEQQLPGSYELKGDSIQFGSGEFDHIKIAGDNLTLTSKNGSVSVWTRIQTFDWPDCN